ncbi:MAG TPA: amidase [Terriglobia bacterium]|nr:amidase [Terriglobia bacterium]
MTNLEELACLDAVAQAELVRKKQVKPTELVDAAISRIELLNPKINAVVTPMYEEARAYAMDERNLPDGPFRGVPYLLKDILSAYAGVPLTSGCSFLSDYVPNHDSELVARLKRSGLIILGKTNTPELALVATTEPRLFGPTRNPWNPARTAGGSSGGSCAAVACGMVPMAHANDGGGSIRIPASCCGVFGLKPTRARITLAPDLGDMMGGLVVEHAVTRSVRDSAALLDATAGPAAGDPYWPAQPARPFLKEVGSDPGRLRIAFSTSAATGAPVDPDCVGATEDAAKLCASLGHDVSEDRPRLPGEELFPNFMTVWAAGCAASINGWARALQRRPSQDQFEPLTWSLYQIGTCVSASSYLLSQTFLQGVSREIARFMAKYDIILTPTLAQPPVPLGSFSCPPLDPIEIQKRLAAFTPFAPLANVSGQPAMSVPLYWNGQDLPIGIHFAGRFGEEATLFRLAGQLERARPWASRWPVVSACT